MGKLTMNMFIWGTVRAITPMPTLVKRRIAVIGALIFMAMMNMSLERWIRVCNSSPEKWKLNGGTAC